MTPPADGLLPQVWRDTLLLAGVTLAAAVLYVTVSICRKVRGTARFLREQARLANAYAAGTEDKVKSAERHAFETKKLAEDTKRAVAALPCSPPRADAPPPGGYKRRKEDK